ncbi:hypothetical protein CEXT_695591 [Caerostris extrusa]|uniref:Ycf15 n=1 Tax=Caerostris extrusa TaxID=172846 RepID=A0AAV4VRN1_CAEEX|nr:hypothetical protein CEXT_695591 [Caerostris extrusa]
MDFSGRLILRSRHEIGFKAPMQIEPGSACSAPVHSDRNPLSSSLSLCSIARNHAKKGKLFSQEYQQAEFSHPERS